MSMRLNAEGQVESVKTVPKEYVSVIDNRQELVDELARYQAAVAEVTQDLAEYDALTAQAAPEAPVAPAAPVDGGAQ